MHEEFCETQGIVKTKNSVIKFFEKVPFGLILAAILFQFIFLFGKTFDKKIKNLIQPYEGTPIIGMIDKVPRSKPIFSLAKIMNGTWQKEYENWFDYGIAFRAPLIRLHNQFYYSIFSKSYMFDGGIIIGKHHYLYELPFLIKYCNSHAVKFQQDDFNLWMDNLKKIADFFQKRGQTFIYLITPSKAAYFPEYLPKNYQCYSDKRSDYPYVVEALKKANIRYVDSAALVMNNKQKYGKALFSQGGLHWTYLGATLTTKKLIEEICNARKMSLGDLRFTTKISHSPIKNDADLINLANLLYPRLHYQVPNITFEKFSQKNSNPLTMVVVGTSFSDFIVQILNDTNLFKQIDLFKYLVLSHTRLRYEEKGLRSFPEEEVNPKTIHFDNTSFTAYQDILKADIVIFEENEVNLRSKHFKAFSDLLLNKKINLAVV